MQEIWKPFYGAEGHFLVSNYGRVKSIDRVVNNWPKGVRKLKGKMLKMSLNKAGYYYVCCWLRDSKKKKNLVVHRAVAHAFVENQENKKCVNHKDGIKTNNDFRNLEWCTHRENMRHAFETGLTPYRKNQKGELAGSAKLKNKDVISIKKAIKNGASLTGLSKKYGVGVTTISEIKAGRSWGHLNV